MPCTYYTPQEEAHIANQRYNKLKKELDKTTRLLCQVCRSLERGKSSIKFCSEQLQEKELAAWWEKHQEMDRMRLAEEKRKAREAAKRKLQQKQKKALKKAALEKLSAAEKKALGL